jgi:hypothetical protein
MRGQQRADAGRDQHKQRQAAEHDAADRARGAAHAAASGLAQHHQIVRPRRDRGGEQQAGGGEQVVHGLSVVSPPRRRQCQHGAARWTVGRGLWSRI